MKAITRDGQVINANAINQEVSYNRNNKIQYNLGERIFHKKFGYGKILSIEDNTLEISFEKAGNKKVLKSFIELVTT